MSSGERSAAARESELLARVADGDAEAFRDLYDRYAGRVLAMLQQICGDPATAEDLLQEVFLAVWRKAGSYREDRGAPSGWIFAVARHRALDHRRRRRALAPLHESVGAEPSAAGGSADLRIGVAQALRTLKRGEREALRMAYFGGFTYEESAARLELPLGTFKSRVASALRRLRAVLGER